MRALLPLALFAPLVVSGCLSGGYSRIMRFTPPDEAIVAGMQLGETTLAHCLERLGAPVYVWEYKGDGVAIAYGASRTREWGLSASLPITQDASVSVDYEDTNARLEGFVLFFDAEWKIEQVRQGFLREIESTIARRRPAPEPSDG